MIASWDALAAAIASDGVARDVVPRQFEPGVVTRPALAPVRIATVIERYTNAEEVPTYDRGECIACATWAVLLLELLPTDMGRRVGRRMNLPGLDPRYAAIESVWAVIDRIAASDERGLVEMLVATGGRELGAELAHLLVDHGLMLRREAEAIRAARVTYGVE